MKLLSIHAFPVFLFQAAACLAPLPLLSAPRPKIVNAPAVALPPIWKNISPSERLSLTRAAEIDATRLLAERIAGVQIDGSTTVRDLSETDDRVRAELQTFITGVKTSEGPTYTEDGRVEVVRQVNIEQLINRIEERYSRRDGGSTSSSFSNTLSEKRKVVFDALGSAAIRGSEGQRRLMAKRAAEVDAYRRLAERAGQTQITSTTTVANFVTQDDTVKAAVVNAVKNAETTEIEFLPDGTAKVTLRMALGPVVRVVARQIKNGESTLISDKTEQLTLEETGSGAAPADGELQVDVTIDSIVQQTLSEKGGLR
jgi:hypothetical protein